jgi:5-methylcytosine-specific restriction endonuclease McrA
MPHRIPTYKPPRHYSHSEYARTIADPEKRRAWQREYDRSRRNQESKHFYNSWAWRNARKLQLHEFPLCYECEKAGRIVAATHVHHIVELTEDLDLALDPANHRSLCASCHSLLHAERAFLAIEKVQAQSKNSNVE